MPFSMHGGFRLAINDGHGDVGIRRFIQDDLRDIRFTVRFKRRGLLDAAVPGAAAGGPYASKGGKGRFLPFLNTPVFALRRFRRLRSGSEYKTNIRAQTLCIVL